MPELYLFVGPGMDLFGPPYFATLLKQRGQFGKDRNILQVW